MDAGARPQLAATCGVEDQRVGVRNSSRQISHGGGLRDYVAEGATILTTAGTRAWVEQTARARFELVPDRLAGSPRPLRVETVADRHVVEDATQRVEFHMTPWDHAREEMIFYRCTDLRQPNANSTAHKDEDEDLEPRTFTLSEARDLLARGEIVDLKTLAGLTLI